MSEQSDPYGLSAAFQDLPDDYINNRDIQRKCLDPLVFGILKQKYGTKLQEFWNSYTPPLESEKAIVIVERRAHANLQFCIQNVAWAAQGWSIYVFCSEKNFQFVQNILGDNKNNIHIIVHFDNTFANPEVGKKEYNDLLQSRSFWEQINAEHIILFETDCYFRKKVPEDELFKYDYMACKWHWFPKLPGGGGLSYRKCSCMLKICDTLNEKDEMQDTYASRGMIAIGAKIQSESETSIFLESEYFLDPIGVHQWWTFTNRDSIFKMPGYINSLITIKELD